MVLLAWLCSSFIRRILKIIAISYVSGMKTSVISLYLCIEHVEAKFLYQ